MPADLNAVTSLFFEKSPNVMSVATFGAKSYIVPLVTEWQVLYYRKDQLAAAGLAGANVSVLNGADGLSEIAAGLVSQGLTILDSVRKGMPAPPQGSTADNGQVVSGQVAQRES